MKNIFKLAFGFLFLAGATLSSCSSDPEDINQDLHLDRALTPLNLKAVVQPTGKDVKITWDVRSSVDHYEVIIYTNETLTNAVKTLSVAPSEVPVTVELDPEYSYYATVQAIAKDKAAKPSHLAQVGPVKTYAIMTALNPVITARGTNSLSMTWDIDEYVSHILVKAVTSGASDIEYKLTAAQVSAGAAEITGLESSTEYNLAVYFNSANRGGDTAWTRPNTLGAVEVTTAAQIYQAINDGAAKIVVKYSATPIDMTPGEGVTNPFNAVTNSFAIYGETTTAGLKPVLKNLSSTLNAGSGAYSIHLEDLNLDGASTANHVVTVATGNVSGITIKNCDIYNYIRGVIYESNAAAVVGDVLFEGLYVRDIEGTGGDVMDMRSGTYNNFTLKNSTFYNGGRAFLFMDANTTVNGSVTISHNTISNFGLTTQRAGVIAVRSKVLKDSPAKFVVEKNLVLNQFYNGTGYTFIADNAASIVPAMSTNYFFNFNGDAFFVATKTSPALAADGCIVNGGKKLTADPCEKSAKGKFYLTNSEIATVGVGDPRWWSAVAPIVPEVTELIPLTDKYTWDFADTDRFDAQDVTRTRIIDNLRFIVASEDAPVKITDKGLVSFAKASTVGADGVPTDNALAFKVMGPGSVIIKPADGGFNKSMEVVVGGVRKSITANGQESVVGFGDLTGENTVYICAGAALNVISLGWTTEVVSGGEAQALATPEPSVAPASIDAGSDTAVTVSWAAVPSAASYDVVLNGKTTNVATNSFAVPTATTKALAAGTYNITVTAKAPEGSKSYTDSEAGATSLKVKAVLTALTAAYTWDIANQTKFPTATIEETVVYDNLQFIGASGAALNIEHLADTGTGATDRLKFNGASTPATGPVPTKRGIAFKVAGSGTLSYKVVSGSSTGTGRMFRVSDGTTQLLNHESALTVADAQVQTLPITVSGETTIYMYASAGLNIYELAWTPGGGGPVATSKMWNFADAAFDSYATAIGTTSNPNYVDTWDGLTITAGGANIKMSALTGATRAVQMENYGSPTTRVFSFDAPAAGKLRIKSSNTGNSVASPARTVNVSVDGGALQSKDGGFASNTPEVVEFDITAGAVLIYPLVGGLRFYSIEYVPN